MSKKILALLLSVAVLSTTACTGVGGQSNKNGDTPPPPKPKSFPTQGKFPGVIAPKSNPDEGDIITVSINNAQGEFTILNATSFKGKFDITQIALSEDKMIDSKCFSGNFANGDKIELHYCGLGDGSLNDKPAFMFGSYATSYDINGNKLKDYIVVFKAE